MSNKPFPFEWRPLGQRIIKTSVAVTLSLLFYMLRGYRGDSMPAEAAITAIICMQPYVHGTKENALNRLSGTLIGACWGFIFLLVMMAFPAIGRHRPLLYVLMGVGTMVALHSAVLMRHPDASGLAAIVFVCVVIAYPDIDNPLDQAFHRILDVMVGTVIAIAVNAVRLPRVKQPDKLFFLPMMYLTLNQFAQMSPNILFQVQNLIQEGANICLISKHAPAFQAAQLGRVKFNVPMIVMDGAAIYDPNENAYVSTTPMNPASIRWLLKRLEGISYFIYTVHRDRNCIYHHGELTDREKIVYQHLKRSPYRYYLDDDHFALSDVLYIKVVSSGDDADRIQRELEPSLEKMKLRSVVRPQSGLEEGCSLYFYAIHADIEHAKQHLMHIVRKDNPNLAEQPIAVEPGYQVDRDAPKLLRQIKNEFAPDIITLRLRSAGRKSD